MRRYLSFRSCSSTGFSFCDRARLNIQWNEYGMAARVNKLTSPSFVCVCSVIDHEFRHNIVKVAVDPRGESRVDPQTTLTML